MDPGVQALKGFAHRLQSSCLLKVCVKCVQSGTVSTESVSMVTHRREGYFHMSYECHWEEGYAWVSSFRLATPGRNHLLV